MLILLRNYSKVKFGFNLLLKHKTIHHTKFNNNVIVKPFNEKNGNDISLKLKFLLGSSGFFCINIFHYHSALCQKANTRAEGYPTEKASDALSKVEPVFEWKLFLKYLVPEIWSLLGAISAALMVAVLNIQLPLYLGNIINILTKFSSSESSSISFISEVRDPALNLVFIYISQSIFTFVYISLLSGVGERMAANLRCDLFRSMLQQDIAFFDKQRTGELVDRLTTDVQEFKSSFKLVISQGLRNGAQVVGCISSLILISPTLTLGMLGIVPVVILSGSYIGSLLRQLSRDAQNQAAKAITIGEEALSNIRTVRAFAMEDYEEKLFQEQVDESCRLQEKLGLGIGLFQAGTNLFLNGMVLGTLYFGGHLMASNQSTAGELMSFLVSTQMIQRSMAQISLLFGHYIKGIASGGRIFQMINMKADISIQDGETIPAHSLIPEINFSNVTFAYPTRPTQVILKDFNLKIPAGQKVAIVGSSGNGKSTVVALLERFYDVNNGSITISGTDLRDLNSSWLRGHVIGLINQEPVLFATTIRENIRYGNSTMSNAQVEYVAKLANAHEFIKSFPNGYDTMVGERGVTISGGQKQRIAIARALLMNPQILILDEATSALDNESEKIVQEALETASKGRTVLMIAHRLSTIQNADIIVVLQAGQIVEMGNHSSLLKKKGHYWNLMNQQTKTN